MKTQFSSFAISALILSATTFSAPAITPAAKGVVKVQQAQSAGFAFFRTHHQGKGITATWGVTSDAGVVGYSVKRTYEDPNDPYSEWEEVSSTACNGSRSYKCTDLNVSPGFINYRVVAMLSDGSTIESSVSTVHVVSH
ncbi:MAG: hypothetical protein ABI675_05850 [Chitinophagaceae bacterium]